MLHKLAMAVFLLTPSVAAAAPPRVLAVYESNVDSVQIRRIQSAVESAVGTVPSATVGRASETRLADLARRSGADLILVATTDSIRVFDAGLRAFGAGRLRANAPRGDIRALLARGAASLRSTRGRSSRTWIALGVVGVAAAIFVAVLALRAGRSQDPETGLRIRFVSP